MATEQPTPQAVPMTISVAFQMDPLWKYGEIGEVVFGGDLQGFAESMTGYLAEQLERFADPRGADLLIQLAVKRGEETAGHWYRSGHYVKADADA